MVVGFFVGSLVGFFVGSLVGFFVGTLVGLFVGIFVGLFVGTFVGFLGFKVGEELVGVTTQGIAFSCTQAQLNDPCDPSKTPGYFCKLFKSQHNNWLKVVAFWNIDVISMTLEVFQAPIG